MNTIPELDDNYALFSEILEKHSRVRRWQHSKWPSLLMVPEAIIADSNLLAVNLTLRDHEHVTLITSSISIYINNFWTYIEDHLTSHDFMDFETIVDGGIVIEGRIYKITKDISPIDDDDENPEQIIGVSIDFQDITDDVIRQRLHLDQLRLSHTGEFILKLTNGSLDVVYNNGFLMEFRIEEGQPLDLSEIMSQESFIVVNKGIEKAISDGSSEFELKVLNLETHEEIWVSVRLNAEPQLDGSFIITGFSTNINTQVKERNEIAQRLQKFEVALMLMSVVHYVVSFDEKNEPRFTKLAEPYVSEPKWAGFDTSEMDAFVDEVNLDPFYKMIHPDDRDMAMEAFRRLLDGPQRIRLRVVTPDGDIKYVENYVIPTRIEDGKVKQAIGGFIDITDSIQREGYLFFLKLMTVFAHDAKTPLSSVMTAIEIIRVHINRDKLTPEILEEYLNQIRNSVGVVNEFIESIEVMAKIQEQGGDAITMKSFDICDFISRIVEQIRSYSSLNKFNLTLPDEFEINTDKDILKHIIINLISNAVKYSPEGSEIDISLENNTNNYVITVRDHGRGIPKADQEKILNQFGRASNAEGVKGSGLGLFLINELAILLGGKITFESVENLGSTFHVEIPNSLYVGVEA